MKNTCMRENTCYSVFLFFWSLFYKSLLPLLSLHWGSDFLLNYRLYVDSVLKYSLLHFVLGQSLEESWQNIYRCACLQRGIFNINVALITLCVFPKYVMLDSLTFEHSEFFVVKGYLKSHVNNST